MTRGHQRLSQQRQTTPETPKRSAAAAGVETGFAVRSLAVNALACTSAAVSVLTPVHALTLGDITVESALGQPLNARVLVTMGPGELLNAGCISVPTTDTTDLTRVPQPVVGVPETSVPGSYDLRITTVRPLYEPMYELQLQIRCPGTALLVRQYVLMLDLPGLESRSAPAAQSTTQAMPLTTASPEPAAMPIAAAVATPARPSAARARRSAHPATPIASGSRYQVQKGDTLSTIAARVSDRGGAGIWQLSDQIFAANPQAFIGSSQDLIRLGAEIDIPGATAPPVVAKAEPLSTAPAEAPLPIAETSQTTQTTVSQGSAPETAVATPAEVESVTPAESPAPETSQTEIAASDTPAAVFQDEQAVPAAVEPTAAAEPAPVADAGDDSAPTWLAALVGILIGVGASFALLRKRLVEALLALARRRGTNAATPATAEAIATPVVGAAPQMARPFVPRESSMVVVEERHDAEDDVPKAADTAAPTQVMRPGAAREFADISPTSELASLFAEETLSMSETQSVGEPQPDEELDLDLTGAVTEMTAVQEIGWIGDETELSPTQRTTQKLGAVTADSDTVEQVDLQTLVEKAATGDQELSQTLKDALKLLESDYEDELTASQVIDRSKLEKLIEGGDDDDTLVRTGTDRNRRR